MAVDLLDPSVGIDRVTGSIITGWDHTVQSINDIFTTTFGERILREWYGSLVPRLLGRLITPQEVLPFFAAIASAIDVWEPRVRVSRVDILEVNRLGEFKFLMDVEWRPRALLGDFTVVGVRRIGGHASDAGVNIVHLAALGNE